MSTELLVYILAAIAVFLITLPLTLEGVRRVLDPSESTWNRTGAALSVLIILLCCVFWLAVLALVAVTQLSDKQKERLRKGDELRRDGY